MKKKFLLMMVMCLLTAFLSACSGKVIEEPGKSASEADEVIYDLKQLRTEAGLYQYKDIPFGSSYEEVAKQIPLNFEKIKAESMPSWVRYTAMEHIDFYGEKAKFSLEFSDDKLNLVQVAAELSGGEEQFQTLVEELMGLYGEAEVLNGEKATAYKWEKNGTYMNAIMSVNDGKVNGVFGVFVME